MPNSLNVHEPKVIQPQSLILKTASSYAIRAVASVFSCAGWKGK